MTQALLKHKRVMVCSCHSSGKSSSQDELIYLANGQRIQAKHLVNKHFNLLTSTPTGIVETHAYANWNKYEDIYEITTESGRKRSVNLNHPFFVARSTDNNTSVTVGGWIRLSHIEVGDLVAVTKEFDAFGNNTLPQEEIKLLAHLLTNSYRESGSNIIIKKSVSQYQEVKDLLEEHGSILSEATQENRYVVINSSVVDRLYTRYFLSPSFRHRKIPYEIFSLNRESTAEFIKTIFKSNTLTIKNDNEAKLKFYHRSEKLIRDLSFLLLKFGISTKVYKKEERDFWVLRILNVEDYVTLFDEDNRLSDLVVGSPDDRLDWRLEQAPLGTYWEKVTSVRYKKRDWTVGICVPYYESYLTDLYEHNSYLAAALTCWNYDAHGESITLTTAPNEDTIKDVIWREIRNHRDKLPEEIRDLYDKSPRMESSPNHFAAGVVAAKGGGIHGRKSPYFGLIFDEATDMEHHYWQAARGLLIAENAWWLCLLNPTDPASPAKIEYDSGKFHTINISALDHPNVISDLIHLVRGLPVTLEDKPYPGVDINLSFVEGWFNDGCRVVEPRERKSYDIEWPPREVTFEGVTYEIPDRLVGDRERRIYRPKADSGFEPRVLGRWPSNTNVAIWNEAMWEACDFPRPEEDAPVEIGCDPAGMGCFDDKTELLTNNGWKLFKDVTLEDKVLTHNLEKDKTEWGPISKVFSYDFKGELNVLKQANLNFAITDNHKLLIQKRKGGPWKIDRFDNLPKNFIIKRTSNWKGQELSPITFIMKAPQPNGGFREKTWTFNPVDWAKFLGWYVAEGCTYTDTHHRHCIVISQRNQVKKTEISSLLTNMGVKHQVKKEQVVFYNSSIAKHLIEFCGKYAKNKRVPEYIKNSTKAIIDTFLETFVKGDGHKYENGRGSYFYSCSELLIDDLQEMLVKIGHSGSKVQTQEPGSTSVIEGRTITRISPTFSLYGTKKSTDAYILGKNIKKEYYNGKVYCVETPYHTIMVRRNGQTMWSGNSDKTSIIVRRGRTVLHHEKRHNWDAIDISNRLKELATEYGQPRGQTPEDVPIKIDTTGNDAVYTHKDNFNFIRVDARVVAMEPDKYVDRRSELWLHTKELAETLYPDATGALRPMIDVSRLLDESKAILKRQLTTARFFARARGRKEVEKKDDMRRRLKESPDDADAFNLAFSPQIDNSVATTFSPDAMRNMSSKLGRKHRR